MAKRRGDALYLRGKTWWLDCRYNGKRYYVWLGRGIGRSAAKEIAQIKRAQILKGEAGIGRKRHDITFDKAAEIFLEWAAANKRPNTLIFYRACTAKLSEAFRGIRLSAITPFLVEKYKQGRVKGGSPVRANRELATLKALFNRCREWKKFEGENPVREVKLLKEPKNRLRYLEAEEEGRLLAAAKEPLRTVILVGIHAGLRIQSEALTLRWEDVDLKRGLVTVIAAYAKSGESRSVNLNSRLREALERLKAASGDQAFVFTKSDGSPFRSIRTALDTACRKAELRDVSPHTCRHTFASRLAMAGVPLRTIQELGGWAELSMVERYSHLSPSHKAEAVERIVALDSQQVSLQGVKVKS